MKKFILIVLILAIHVSGFSQMMSENNSYRANVIPEENITSTDVKIYPNPCKEEIVTVEFNNQQIKEIRLTNIIGKEVFLKKYPYSENKKQIELNDIPNGIYIMKIITSDETVVVKKLMVSKI